MSLETIVGQQPAHVRMPGKEHAIEIVSFTLEPVRAGKYVDERRNRSRLIDFRLHADAQVLLRRQEMIHNVEAALAARPIDRGDVDKAPKLASLVVAQKRDDLHDVVADRGDRQLAVCNAIPRERACKRAGDGLAEFVEPIIHCGTSISARSCRCGGSSSAATTRRRAVPRRSAGSRERRYRPARCGHSRARPSRSSGNSRRRWRTSPWK